MACISFLLYELHQANPMMLIKKIIFVQFFSVAYNASSFFLFGEEVKNLQVGHGRTILTNNCF